MRRNAEASLAVFSRAPLPGAAKTRLIPRLGAAGAADLQAALTRHAIETALAADLGDVSLWCDPDDGHPFFADCRARYGVRLETQQGADLGQRMHHALVRLAARGRAALLMGSDTPSLTPRDLAAAAQALQTGCPAVFVPAEDGGYVLIGVRRSETALFDDVEWGTENVMAQTRNNLRRLGWRWTELASRWDVDRPEDLPRLAACGMLGSFAHRSS